MASDLSSRFNGNNILDSSPCGLRVDWSYVRVFSWFALQMNHENQTTKSHEPGITKRHKGSADESSMLLPSQSEKGNRGTQVNNLRSYGCGKGFASTPEIYSFKPA